MDISNENLVYNHRYYKTPAASPEAFMKHSHNTYELIFFEKGNVTYFIEGKRYKLKKNDLVFIRPMKFHYVDIQPDSEYSRFNIAFGDSFVGKKLLDSVTEEIELVHCPEECVVTEIFAKTDYYAAHLDEDAFTDVLAALLKELFYSLRISENEFFIDSSKLSPILGKAVDYINDNLFTVKDIKEVADKLYVSEQYLFRIFQNQIKISPKKYINNKRLLFAQSMLRQGMRPTDIYEKCGFDSYPGFYKQYVATFGYAPSKEKPAATLR